MDLVALKAELTTDPLSRGYAAMSDEQAATNLNTPNRNPNRETLDSGLLIASIVRSEYVALTANEKDYVRLIAMAQSLPLTQNLKSELGAVFGANTQTRANLLALMVRPGSRAEELGLGAVTPSDVADARRLP